MTDPWVCIDCGARQDARGKCRACGHEDTLDAQDEKVRELMRDVDLRLSLRREGRIRVVGVAVGMIVVIALWMVPGYWDLRGRVYPGLPLLADQWMLMAAIAFGVIKLVEAKLVHKRFPYLRDDFTMD